MKCRLLKPTMILNPAFSEADAVAAIERKETYEVPREVEVDAGYEIEDPRAWIHCCPGVLNSAPIAEPADAECTAKVKEFMEVQRPQAIAQIKAQLDQIESFKDPEHKKRLLALGKAYGLLPAG